LAARTPEEGESEEKRVRGREEGERKSEEKRGSLSPLIASNKPR